MMIKKKQMIIVGIAIFIILVLIIMLGIFIAGRGNKAEQNTVETVDVEKNLGAIFDNTNVNEEIVYLRFDIDESENGKYDVKANIPGIKIDTEITKKINENIRSRVKQMLTNIIAEEDYTTYTVDYKTYINGDIVSLVVKEELKESVNPKKLMIQTYNYDMKNDKELSLEELIENNSLEKTFMQEKILGKINTQNDKLKEAKEQGYNVFMRDVNSDIYKIENIDTYFLGDDGKLCIVFAYGNDNYTSETDTITF